MRYSAFILALLTLTSSVFAGTLEPTDLSPIKHRKAHLTVVSPEGKETVYTPADLETLPTFKLKTKTPWRDTPALFEGILLSDLLERNGLNEVSSINVIAENEYTVVLTREVLKEVPILIATRVNGKAHTRRARGPIQFIIDHASYNKSVGSELVDQKYFVWMAARIEPKH